MAELRYPRLAEWLAPSTRERPGAGLLEQLDAYLALLVRWNSRMNLTADREPERIAARHFGESLVLAENLPDIGTLPARLLDHGSGAGFPGLVIALARPEISVTLAESHARKAAFLQEAVRALAPANVRVFGGRTEGLDEDFSWVTARAVDEPSTAVSTAWGRTVVGGFLITTAAPPDGVEAQQVQRYELDVAGTRYRILGPRAGDVPRGT